MKKVKRCRKETEKKRENLSVGGMVDKGSAAHLVGIPFANFKLGFTKS